MSNNTAQVSLHWSALLCSEGCEIVGIEIVDGAKPVQSFPFKGNTAFMLGNEVSVYTADWH